MALSTILRIVAGIAAALLAISIDKYGHLSISYRYWQFCDQWRRVIEISFFNAGSIRFPSSFR
jgi:hypothetical protein